MSNLCHPEAENAESRSFCVLPPASIHFQYRDKNKEISDKFRRVLSGSEIENPTLSGDALIRTKTIKPYPIRLKRYTLY